MTKYNMDHKTRRLVQAAEKIADLTHMTGLHRDAFVSSYVGSYKARPWQSRPYAYRKVEKFLTRARKMAAAQASYALTKEREARTRKGALL